MQTQTLNDRFFYFYVIHSIIASYFKYNSLVSVYPPAPQSKRATYKAENSTKLSQRDQQGPCAEHQASNASEISEVSPEKRPKHSSNTLLQALCTGSEAIKSQLQSALEFCSWRMNAVERASAPI